MKISTTSLMMVIFNTMFAQSKPVMTDSIRNAEYREKIGLDLFVPDFETKKIDAKVMGPRQAGILEYLLENFHKVIYESYFARILSEQHEALHNKYFDIKKMKFISASKKDNKITILMKVWPGKTIGDMKQADFEFIFTYGVSDSRTTNELFSTLSRYVQAREKLNQ